MFFFTFHIVFHFKVLEAVVQRGRHWWRRLLLEQLPSFVNSRCTGGRSLLSIAGQPWVMWVQSYFHLIFYSLPQVLVS